MAEQRDRADRMTVPAKALGPPSDPISAGRPANRVRYAAAAPPRSTGMPLYHPSASAMSLARPEPGAPAQLRQDLEP